MIYFRRKNKGNIKIATTLLGNSPLRVAELPKSVVKWTIQMRAENRKMKKPNK